MPIKTDIVIEDVPQSIEDAVRKAVNAELDDYVEIENDGIGYYEYGGAPGNDRGTDYAVITGCSVALNATGLSEEEHELDQNVYGTLSCDHGGQLEWVANFKRKVEEDGKTWLIYDVEAN